MKKILFTAFPVLALSFAFTTVSDPLPIGASMPNPDLKMKDVS